MPERERSDAGTFVEKVSLDAVRDVFDAVRGPVITSSDVADQLDCTTEAARQKLTRLYDRGEVDKRKTGRTVVYWRTGGERITPDEGAVESHAERARERGETRADHNDDQQDAPTARADTDPIAAALDGWEPDTEASPRSARTQTRRAAEWLRDVGEYRRAGELKDALAEDSTLAPRVWWERHARPGLNHLADAALVEYTKNRGYRWVGDTEDADAGGVYDPTEEF